MAYPSRADLVTASEVAELTGASNEKQDGWYAVAKRAVESFCGQRFDSEDTTLVEDGDGSRLLPLRRRLAVLTAISGEASSIGVGDVEIVSPDHNALRIKASAAGGGNWVERLMRDGVGVSFPLGRGTVSITGTWGWTDAELPADVDTAIGIALRLDMEDQALADDHGLASTVRAQARLGIREISQGPLSADIEPVDIPLSPEVQAVLEPYIWEPVGGAA